MLSGILLLDKPVGLSSNAALQRVRRLLGAEKAGHVGSLDPLATGMLPICLGEATKIAGDILSGRKCYRFTVALGARTATGDTEGAVVETSPVPALDRTTVEQVLQRFAGTQKQIPPMYSALKQGGQPLYKLARAGVEVERAAREIQIFDLVLRTISVAEPPNPATDASSDSARKELDSGTARLELDVLCSKGTYVRTLAEDIAKALGTCGHVTALRRLHVEPFENEAMETLESVAAAREGGTAVRILPADWPLGHLPSVNLSAAAAVRLMHGQAVMAPTHVDSGRVRVYDAAGRFLGIGESDAQGTVRPRRLFVS